MKGLLGYSIRGLIFLLGLGIFAGFLIQMAADAPDSFTRNIMPTVITVTYWTTVGIYFLFWLIGAYKRIKNASN